MALKLDMGVVICDRHDLDQKFLVKLDEPKSRSATQQFWEPYVKDNATLWILFWSEQDAAKINTTTCKFSTLWQQNNSTTWLKTSVLVISSVPSGMRKFGNNLHVVGVENSVYILIYEEHTVISRQYDDKTNMIIRMLGHKCFKLQQLTAQLKVHWWLLDTFWCFWIDLVYKSCCIHLWLICVTNDIIVIHHQEAFCAMILAGLMIMVNILHALAVLGSKNLRTPSIIWLKISQNYEFRKFIRGSREFGRTTAKLIPGLSIAKAWIHPHLLDSVLQKEASDTQKHQQRFLVWCSSSFARRCERRKILKTVSHYQSQPI